MRRIGIVVPACDEEAHIGATIGSLRASLSYCRGVEGRWIVVVCDSCTDDTAARARAALHHDGEVIECAVKCVGRARRIGARALLKRFRGIDTRGLWISNTDADTTVPLDWIHTQLHFANQGWTAIAGIVRVQDIDGDSGEIVARLFDDYQVEADGSHPHVHGANLGVRADVYLSVGGWSPLSLSEDHCLWARVKRAGWATLSTSRLMVTTSGRLTGRAAGGFADTLRRKWQALYV